MNNMNRFPETPCKHFVKEVPKRGVFLQVMRGLPVKESARILKFIREAGGRYEAQNKVWCLPVGALEEGHKNELPYHHRTSINAWIGSGEIIRVSPLKQEPAPPTAIPTGDGKAGRGGPVSATWLSKLADNRENDQTHPSAGELVTLLWRQGFGPVAAARMLDWYCSCHPENIAAAATVRESAAD